MYMSIVFRMDAGGENPGQHVGLCCSILYSCFGLFIVMLSLDGVK
jgi:hypothetical protein